MSRKPPRPAGLALVNMLRYARDPLGTLLAWERELGPVYEAPIPGMSMVVVSDAALVERVLLDRERWIKDAFTRKIELVTGKGLLVSEGDFWRRQRRLAQPAFHHKRVESYAAWMVEESERMLGGWRGGERRDLHAELMSLTLAIVSRTLFGSDVSADAKRIGDAIDALMRAYLGVANTGWLVPSFIPTPSNVRAKRAVEDLDAIVMRFVRARRQSGDDPGDLLSMLLATDEEGASMSDLQVRDECITLLLAGHETTALALTYVFHLLGTHPAARARLEDELDGVLGGRAPTFGDLRQLRFTDAVVREAMRLYPPAWAIGRESLTDLELGGFHLPRGAQVILPQWVVHRSPEHFPEPEAFRPERWLDDLDKRLPRFAYFPFGGGARICIGNAFASMEATLVLACVAQRFRFRLKDTGPLELMPSVTVRPKHGLPGTLDERVTKAQALQAAAQPRPA